MTQKILTVTIPTWNRAKLLEELLTQLIEQIVSDKLEDDIELLVSNNNSEDNTHEIVLELKARYSFITYNKNETNIGANPNVMKSMELPSSKYLILFGDDDRVEKGSLMRIVNFLKSNQNAGLVVDSSKFKNRMEDAELTLPVLLRNYYWNIGNAGVFIVKPSYARESLQKYGAGFFNECWAQTQIMILGLNGNKDDKIYIKDFNIVSTSVHQEVTIYNCFYLWRTGYFELFMALKAMDKIVGRETLKPAYEYMKDNIFQFALFNILQFGVFIDGKELRVKTRKHILKYLKPFSFYEKVILMIIVLALWIPQSFAKFLGNFFILITKGKSGITKKNEFVKMELGKRKKAENLKSKAIRKLEFEKDNY